MRGSSPRRARRRSPGPSRSCRRGCRRRNTNSTPPLWADRLRPYAIINPQETYQPIVTALQRRDETKGFGWLSYRDWGGLLKIFVVYPGLRREIGPPDEPIDIDDEADFDALRSRRSSDRKEDDNSDVGGEELVVYGGFEPGYDFRETQTLWVKPILYFPDSGTIVPDTGQRYTRPHYGRATDAAHELANHRVPIGEWWTSIYDDVETGMSSSTGQ